MKKLLLAAVAATTMSATAASAITILDVTGGVADVTGTIIPVDVNFEREYVFQFAGSDLTIGALGNYASASLGFDGTASSVLPLPGFATTFTFTGDDFNPGASILVAWSDVPLSFDGTSFSGGTIFDIDAFDPTAFGAEALVTTAFQAPDLVQYLNIAFNGLNKNSGTNIFAEVNTIPLPASLLLFASALAGLGFVSRGRKA